MSTRGSTSEKLGKESCQGKKKNLREKIHVVHYRISKDAGPTTLHSAIVDVARATLNYDLRYLDECSGARQRLHIHIRQRWRNI